MVKVQQIIKLRKYMNMENNLSKAAAKSGMTEKTARKYLESGQMPGEVKKEREWRTRPDPFAEVWDEVRPLLENNPRLQAKTLFEHLQRTHQGKFQDGQRRSFERRVKDWRVQNGPPNEVFFPQKHYPGKLCASDFTNMNELKVTINGLPFDHLFYHFVLPYSNWETGTICYSESFESLSAGFQNALWELGGLPVEHLTDRLSAAVNNLSDTREFTKNYTALLRYFGMSGRKTQTGSGNENGDAEQSHNRFKNAADQALMMRGSRDFNSIEKYGQFLKELLKQLNSGRKKLLAEELKVLRKLPTRRIDSWREIEVRVSKFSTIRVLKNVYSQDSRLIGEILKVRILADELEIRRNGKLLEKIPRLRGESKHRINYRHVIHSLVKKPGAFEDYLYHEDLFPSTHFRIAYDLLKEKGARFAAKEYLKILKLAADESEAETEHAIRLLLKNETEISFEAAREIVASRMTTPSLSEAVVEDVDLKEYDNLLEEKEVA